MALLARWLPLAVPTVMLGLRAVSQPLFPGVLPMPGGLAVPVTGTAEPAGRLGGRWQPVRTPQLATHSVRVLAIPLLLAGLVAGVAPAASASAARFGARLNGVATAASATSNPIVGDWHVTYGNRAVVKMTLKAGKYTETAKTRVRVTGSSCFLPAGHCHRDLPFDRKPFLFRTARALVANL